EHRKRPLVEHLSGFCTALAAKGNTREYVELVQGRLERLAAGCGWRTLNDLSASQADEWIARQRTTGRDVPDLPAGAQEFTPAEVAKLLGVTTEAVRTAVRRHGLGATGQGRARRLPRATVQALLDRQAGQGAGAQTRNYYRTHLKTFGNWLVKDKR